MTAVLEVRALCKEVGSPARKLFDGLDLVVEPGMTVAVCGRSGCGKSTLLNVVGGMDADYRGEVKVDGSELRSLSDDERSLLRLRKIGMVFQAFHLVEHLSLLQNVLLPTRFATRAEREPARGRAMELLEKIGMASRAFDTPQALSGGERQRVAIARALLMRPALLLADEPTGNLDRKTADAVLDVFSELAHGAEAGVLLVTHDPNVARRANRTVWLEGGQLDESNMRGADA